MSSLADVIVEGEWKKVKLGRNGRETDGQTDKMF
jgi:hypothetical protein